MGSNPLRFRFFLKFLLKRSFWKISIEKYPINKNQKYPINELLEVPNKQKSQKYPINKLLKIPKFLLSIFRKFLKPSQNLRASIIVCLKISTLFTSFQLKERSLS